MPQPHSHVRLWECMIDIVNVSMGVLLQLHVTPILHIIKLKLNHTLPPTLPYDQPIEPPYAWQQIPPSICEEPPQQEMDLVGDHIFNFNLIIIKV